MNRTERKALERRSGELASQLPLPIPFDLDAFCAALGRERNRPLRVVHQPAAAVAGLPCGMWIELPDQDLIFVEPRTSRHHQAHIGLHEVAHILCGHCGADVPVPFDLSRLVPHLDPAAVARMLGRTSYGQREEAEAELLATLLGERIARSERLGLGAAASEGPSASAFGKLARVLGGP